MTKATFQETFDKTLKFYDFQYHLHKSSFKGLANWMKTYSQLQKTYAQKLFQISKNMVSYVPEYGQQMPAVENSLNDLVECVSTFSQLHFNYSERLSEVSNSLFSEYNSSKRLKQKHMRVLKDQFQDKISTSRESKIKSKIITSESHICKSLFEHLDKFTQEQVGRTQKMKEQVLIYLALSKKIQEKQLQMTTKFKGKISQQEIEVKIPQIDQISKMLINQHNSYVQGGESGSGQKLSPKKYDRIQPIQILRESMKESTLFREKANKMNSFNTKITQSLKNYERIPENFVNFNGTLQQKHEISGLFDRDVLNKSATYSNLVKNDIIKKMSYGMLNSFYCKSKQSDTKLILFTIKGKLKIGSQGRNEPMRIVSQFLDKELSRGLQIQSDKFKSQQNKDIVFHVVLLRILNDLYFIAQEEFREQDSINQNTLIQFLKCRQAVTILPYLKHKNQLHINISSVFLKIILTSLISVQQDEPLLIDDFTDYLTMISKFSNDFLNVPENIVKLLFLQLVENAIRTTKSKYIEEIHKLIENTSSNNKKISNQSPLKQSHTKVEKMIVASIIVSITQGIINFYKLGIPLINFFSILACLQNLSSEKFSAVQYFHKCIKRAGYTYIFWIDEEKKIIEPVMWQGQMRLKNLVQTLQMLEYNKLEETHFVPTAQEMTHILGVDQSVILRKMKQEFLQALGDIVEQNVDLLAFQQGIDKEGYILKLGVFLAQLDIPGFKPADFQKKYFKVLDLYLTNTQSEYNTLLDHSRKTQLWIMEENTLATQNCIDFCSLLYKPFEFLLKTIKLLAQQNKTPFTQEFNQFIKNKLNTILKQQICKYINFLYDSLRAYYFEEPQIHYKPKRGDNILVINEQENEKIKIVFKEIIRRLYNLNFLKEQLNQIIHDFLEEDIYQDLGQSIFNLENLTQAAVKYKHYRQILNNLKDIVETISSVEEKLIFRVSDITVFHCMRRLFYNLYFQEEKSAFDEFFSTKSDYKFSPFTFVRYQKQFEDVFSLIKKHIPEEIQAKYYPRLIAAFFKALKSQLLNSTKFKLPKPKEEVVRFLDQDCSFICTLLKQRFVAPQIIQNQLSRPLKRVLSTLQASTKDLIQKYEAETLNNNISECKYILIILYLRTNDEKAQEFFKKFKNMIFK